MQQVQVGVGVIIIQNAKVLLGKRLSKHGEATWGFPGGHLEYGETVEECAKREVLEETGITLRKLEQGPFTNDIFDEKHYITLFVITHIDKAKPKVLEKDKCSEWEWFEWHELPDPLFLPIQNLVKIGFSPHKWNSFTYQSE